LDVAHRLGEDVGAFLFEQRRRHPGGEGQFVDLPRRGALLDHPHDPPRADDHGHLIDRRLVRQREYVHRLDGFLERVGEGLGDPDAGDEAGDLRLDVGVLQGTLDDRAVLPFDAERALRDVVLDGRRPVAANAGRPHTARTAARPANTPAPVIDARMAASPPLRTNARDRLLWTPAPGSVSLDGSGG